MATAVEPPPSPPKAGRARRVVRTLSTLLLVVGVLVLIDAGLTVTWQEPVTAGLAAIRQGQLSGDFTRLEDQGPTAVERRALQRLAAAAAKQEADAGDAAARAAARQDAAERRLAFLARSLKRRATPGSAIARIEIPRLGLDKVVVDGSDSGDLRKGPGFYDQKALPGVSGTAAIAGHRTTYGAPFRHIDRLQAGDTIRVKMPYATFTYTVERRRIVPPTALWVVDDTGEDRLVLSACHPLFSAKERLIVFAKLTHTQPTGSPGWTTVGARTS